MAGLGGLNDFLYSGDPVYQANKLKLTQAQMEAHQALAKQNAQNALYGGVQYGPDGKPLAGPNGQPIMGQAFASQQPQDLSVTGNPADHYMVYPQAPLLGRAPGPTLLNSGPEQFAQQQAALVNQADPEAALKMQQAMSARRLNADAIAGLNLPADVRQVMSVEAFAPKTAEAMGKNLEGSPQIRLVKGLDALIASKGGPDNPDAKSYVDLLQKETQKLTPEELAHVKAETGASNAAASLSGARQKQIEQGSISDEDMTDLVDRYIETNDKTLMTTLGRGTQGSANLARFQSAANRRMKELGLSQREIEMKGNAIKTAGATLTDFAKGKGATLTRTANTSTAHLIQLDELGDALDNNNVKAANAIMNEISSQFGGAPIASYQAAAKVVGDEVNKFISGGPGAADDRAAYAKSLSSSLAPQQRKAAIGALKGLMGSQLASLELQYRSGTGLNDYREKLFPHVAALLDHNTDASGGAAAPAATPQAPVAPGAYTWTPNGLVPK